MLELNNRVAVSRGPLLYCLEAVDNEDFDLRDFAVSGGARDVTLESSSDLGVVVKLVLDGRVARTSLLGLYRPLETAEVGVSERRATATPYYA